MSAERLQLWKSIVDHDRHGNLSQELKDKLTYALASFTQEIDFGDDVMRHFKATELSLFDRPEDGKKHARVVIQVDVHRGMMNSRNNLHGGCITYLVDICSSVALSLLGIATGGPVELVSQSINTIFHAGATLGDRLHIINESVSAGSRAVTARVEIWDITHHRLVATGTHIKMTPGVPKTKL
ncbi:uncharacterized protein FIBRA_07741 [Fibroporia radiculosa]|uniref:Thioesterase domain-containing protein n=1 Tax=Fibroporia radiculosa TaxID=599839 RepID=J4GVI8_9APHY|nr:uncharacterized protein FIBRA_07741 [Fibroporia radiculosa]CCM05515.1 predicted protein [Fibroporia radiculosa]